MNEFTVINTTTDDTVGVFVLLAEARKVARKLPAYAIYDSNGRRVEWCEPHPDDMIPHEDTPCLERPWWETER